MDKRAVREGNAAWHAFRRTYRTPKVATRLRHFDFDRSRRGRRRVGAQRTSQTRGIPRTDPAPAPSASSAAAMPNGAARMPRLASARAWTVFARRAFARIPGGRKD